MTWLWAIPAVLQVGLAAWVALRLRRPAPSLPAPGRVPATARPGDVVCLVAARNEALTIGACLDALAAQTLPLRVVVIDDGSSDGTGEEVRSRANAFGGRLTLIQGGPGKALALQAGLDGTESPVILTTDADCRPPPEWAESMVRELGAGVLGGCTTVQGRSALAALEALDWAILLGVSAAASEAGHPVTAMGNNMALRRDAVEAIGGFTAVAGSVTEDYEAFRRIAATREARLVMKAELVNRTESAGTLAAVFRQRKRWAAGALSAGSMRNALVLAGALAAHLGALVVLALAPLWGAGIIMARWGGQLAVAAAASRRMRVDLPLAWIPIHDLLMAAYTVLTPLSLLLFGVGKWKDRTAADLRTHSDGA